jgi:type IV pilus assembly protein PilC
VISIPKYSYTALDLDNRQVHSLLDARDETDLRAKLRSQNLVPLKYRVLEEAKVRYRMKANETAEFSRQLASMLSSGITVVRAVEILLQRDVKPQIRRVYLRLQKDLQQGYTLSEAMRLQGKVFPELLINMYASGEASGQLEQVTLKMAVQYEKEHRLNGKVKGAMTYPIILLAVTIIVVLVLFIGVLPQIFMLFETEELPPLTQIMVVISDFLRTRWYIAIAGGVGLVLGVRYLLAVPAIRKGFDRFKLKFGPTGRLLKIIYTARFSRTLASLYTSGVSMLTSLEICATILGNKYMESLFPAAILRVRNGEALSDAMDTVQGFDRKLTSSIMIGEESGRLDAMLESIADGFDYEAEMATDRLVRMLEPVMIVIMALIVGVIMVAVMMPIFNMASQFENM